MALFYMGLLSVACYLPKCHCVREKSHSIYNPETCRNYWLKPKHQCLKVLLKKVSVDSCLGMLASLFYFVPMDHSMVSRIKQPDVCEIWQFLFTNVTITLFTFWTMGQHKRKVKQAQARSVWVETMWMQRSTCPFRVISFLAHLSSSNFVI